MLKLFALGKYATPIIVLQNIVVISTTPNHSLIDKYDNTFKIVDNYKWHENLYGDITANNNIIISFNKSKIIYYNVFNETSEIKLVNSDNQVIKKSNISKVIHNCNLNETGTTNCLVQKNNKLFNCDFNTDDLSLSNCVRQKYIDLNNVEKEKGVKIINEGIKIKIVPAIDGDIKYIIANCLIIKKTLFRRREINSFYNIYFINSQYNLVKVKVSFEAWYNILFSKNDDLYASRPEKFGISLVKAKVEK